MSFKRRRSGKRAAPLVDRNLSFRTFSVRAASCDEKERSVEAQITTETPVPMPDWDRYEMVPEVLLASGGRAPDQVPLLDSHMRRGMDNQLGSARGLRIDGGGYVGRLHFSSAADSEWTKVREGHATDVSAGYQVEKKRFIPKGETQTIDGREFTGPVNVATQWRLREVSLVPIGADEQAKLRGLEGSPFSEGERILPMDPELKKFLVSRGMPAETSDADAQKWIVANAARLAPEPKKTEEKPPEVRGGLTADDVAKIIAEGVRKAREEERAAQEAFRGEVKALCELADCPDLEAEARNLSDVAAVRKFLAETKAKRIAENPLRPAPHVRITGEGRERFAQDVGTALVLRCLDGVAPPEDHAPEITAAMARFGRQPRTREQALEKVFPKEQRGKGWEQFRHISPYQIAERLVQLDGFDTARMTREQIAICAMFGPAAAGLRSGGTGGPFGPAYITTGNLTNITLDAINKSMQLGYVEAPSTWEGPMRQGVSAQDFKTIHRIRLGAIPNLPVWPDNQPPSKASFADAQEQYAVEARSIEIGYSYRLLVNDDLDMLSRTPGMMGTAARRTVNAVAWGQVTSNPTMTDGQALFLATPTGNRKRSNFTSPGAVPSVAQLQTNTNLMMQMRGENTPEGNEGADVLALMPRYIAGPSALRTTILQLVLSAYDPAANAFQRYNTATELIPVIEPLLDASSTTAWYLFASPAQIDTVELTFLVGQESPIVRNFLDERTLTQYWTVLQTYAAKAMNHRGIVEDNGA